jgi:hypothetical protein
MNPKITISRHPNGKGWKWTYHTESVELDEALFGGGKKIEDHHYTLINTNINRRVGHGTVWKTKTGAEIYHKSRGPSWQGDHWSRANMKIMTVGDAKKRGVPEHDFRNLAVSEEVELDELSKDTLNSYWKKAEIAAGPLHAKARRAQTQMIKRIRSGKPIAGYKPKDELTPDEARARRNHITGMIRAARTLYRSEELDPNLNDVFSAEELAHFEAVMNEGKPSGSHYAIGMAAAKKMRNDEPPLEKKTIKKAHEIAKAIAKEN